MGNSAWEYLYDWVESGADIAKEPEIKFKGPRSPNPGKIDWTNKKEVYEFLLGVSIDYSSSDLTRPGSSFSAGFVKNLHTVLKGRGNLTLELSPSDTGDTIATELGLSANPDVLNAIGYPSVTFNDYWNALSEKEKSYIIFQYYLALYNEANLGNTNLSLASIYAKSLVGNSERLSHTFSVLYEGTLTLSSQYNKPFFGTFLNRVFLFA